MALGNDSPDRSFSVRWLFLPPFTALLTVFIANSLGTGQRIPVDPAVWGLTGLLFVVLTVLYGIFIRQEFFRGLFPVQLIAQGLLLSPLSLHVGARMLQWVGVTMTVCGSVVLIALYYYRPRPAVSVPPAAESLIPDVTLLPLLLAVTDGNGNVLSVSNALLKLTGADRAETLGREITRLFSLEEKNVSLGGMEWTILQTPMNDGIHYFQLEEVRDEPAVAVAPVSESASFVDPATTLYTRAYAEKRVLEEFYRIRRYQRWMSAVLLRMVFSYPSGAAEQPAKEDAVFRAYCHFVRSNTREADISCLVGPQDVLVVMPETSKDAGKDVAGKLTDFKPHIQDLLADFKGSAGIRSGVVFFGAGSGGFGFEEFMYKMDEALLEGTSS